MPADGERIRVMRIIARLNVGGPALQVSGLVRLLDSARFDHRLYAGHVERGEADFVQLRASDLPVHWVSGLGRSPDALGDLRAFRTLLRQMRQFRPHIVHTHTAKAGVLGRVAALAARVPYLVHTYHGHLLHGYFSPVVTDGVVRVERLLARRTDRLVSVGGQVRDDLVAAGIGRPDQYRVVPPGIPLGDLPPRDEARRILGLPATGAIVMLVARLVPVKRVDRFVELARRLGDSPDDTTFAVVGDGPLGGELRSSAAALGSRVRFLGWRSDVETVHAASDIAVLCSDNEGMPVSLIEAALAGVPAVTTRVGSSAEVVLDGTTGFVTEPSAEALAAAVTTLLADNALRSRMGQAARERAETLFSQQRLARDTQALYEEILREGR